LFDLEHYINARQFFTIDEWIDVLLSAIDYNPKGYVSKKQKITLLSRLLPFVEKRINLIEYAPKETGKSYVYAQLSKYGWLADVSELLTRLGTTGKTEVNKVYDMFPQSSIQFNDCRRSLSPAGLVSLLRGKF
jgi:predicted ATP-dependent Lon-type protease